LDLGKEVQVLACWGGRLGVHPVQVGVPQQPKCVAMSENFSRRFFVFFVDYCLFSLSDKFPVCHMFNVEDHVSAKHKLTWGFSQGYVEG
jgi:hypothetical protein